MGKLLNGLMILAPMGGILYAYQRLRASASERRLAAAQLTVYGDPIR